MFTSNLKEKDWLNPIAMHSLQSAIRGGRKEVTLNGRKFRLERGYHWTSNYDGEHELVKVTPVDGMPVPMGYISVERILKYDFESDV